MPCDKWLIYLSLCSMFFLRFFLNSVSWPVSKFADDCLVPTARSNIFVVSSSYSFCNFEVRNWALLVRQSRHTTITMKYMPGQKILYNHSGLLLGWVHIRLLCLAFIVLFHINNNWTVILWFDIWYMHMNWSHRSTARRRIHTQNWKIYECSKQAGRQTMVTSFIQCMAQRSHTIANSIWKFDSNWYFFYCCHTHCPVRKCMCEIYLVV